MNDPLTADHECGPGIMAGPIQKVPVMPHTFRETHGASFLFPLTSLVMVFGSWIVLAFFETCIFQGKGLTFTCVEGILNFSTIAGIAAVLAALTAFVAQVIYHPIQPFPTKASELSVALLISFLLGVVSYGASRWGWYFPDLGIQFFGWIGVSLLVCGIALIVVNYCSRGKSQS